MKGRFFLVAIIAFLLFGSLGRVSGTDFFPVEPTRFYSSCWMMWWDYADKKNNWAQLDTTLKDAGLTWTQPYWEWSAIERTPSGSAETGIIHTYKTKNLDLLSEQIDYLKDLDYRIALVIDPSMGLWRWSKTPWEAKARAGDADAQQAFYETMKKLATRFRGKVDAWQIDQESGDADVGGYDNPQAFARLLRAGYRGIKAGDSQAFVFWSDAVFHGWTAKVLAYLTENYSSEELFPFMDGLAPHLFRTRGADHDKGLRSRPNAFTGTLTDTLTLYHLVGRDYGISWENTTPVGMVQTPYSTYGTSPHDINNNVVTFEQQANYRARKAVIELTLDYVWSGWSRHAADRGIRADGAYPTSWQAYWGNAGIIKNKGDTTGLIDRTGDSTKNVQPDPPYREKKAWWALNTLGGNFTAGGKKKAGVLKGTRFLSRLQLGATQHGYRFLNPDNENMVTVIWDGDLDLEPSGKSTVTLKSPGTVNIISRDGDFLFSRRGTFKLDIGPAPQYVIGTLVEPNRASVHKISNDGFPAVWGFRDTYIIDIQTESAANKVEVTVPAGWTLPQTINSAQAGLVTVEPGPSVPSPKSVNISGKTISINFDVSNPLPAGGTLRIYYGDVREQAVLLDPGLNGVLAAHAPRQFLAPPDNAYHKLAWTSTYNDCLGYGFDRLGTGSWYKEPSLRKSIFADSAFSSNTDNSSPWILKAKVGAGSYQVKVYREDSIAGNEDDYLKGQRITIGDNDTPEYETDSVLIFTNVAPQNGQLSINVKPAKNPKSGKWISALYGVDIWPSELGAGPSRKATLGENRFKVQITPLRGASLLLSPEDLTITVVSPTRLPPVASWPMDEGRGTIISGATANEGTINGAAWTTGKMGSALKFDGVDDYVSIDNASSLDIDNTITVMAWVYPEFDIWPDYSYVQSREDAYNMLSFKEGRLSAALHDGSGWKRLYSDPVVPLNRWSHVAGSFDGSILRLYLNGSEIASSPLKGWSGNINTGTKDLIIGAYDSPGTGKGFFQGKIDMVKVYDIDLTAGEIAKEYRKFTPVHPPTHLVAIPVSSSRIDLTWRDNSDNEEGFKIERKSGRVGGKYARIDSVRANAVNYPDTGLALGTTYDYRVRAYNASGDSTYSREVRVTTDSVPSPVASWPMNEGKGITTSDATVNSNDGTINGAIWTTGKVGSALKFDGIDDYVSVPDTPDSILDITEALTLESWIYPEFDSWPDYTFSVAKKQAYYLGLVEGKLRMALRGSHTQSTGAPNWTKHDSSALLPLNQWTHIAGTFDGSLVKLYVNGVEIYSGSVETGWGPLNINDESLCIGSFADVGGRWNRYFQGKIDEVKVYDRTLTNKEVERKYPRGMK